MLEVARRDGSQVDIRNCERGGELYRETYSHVPADNELLLLNVFDFDPRTAAPAGLVDRLGSLRHQPFQQELACDVEKLSPWFRVTPLKA